MDEVESLLVRNAGKIHAHPTILITVARVVLVIASMILSPHLVKRDTTTMSIRVSLANDVPRSLMHLQQVLSRA
jgi:hypothetical protein